MLKKVYVWYIYIYIYKIYMYEDIYVIHYIYYSIKWLKKSKSPWYLTPTPFPLKAYKHFLKDKEILDIQKGMLCGQMILRLSCQSKEQLKALDLLSQQPWLTNLDVQ